MADSMKSSTPKRHRLTDPEIDAQIPSARAREREEIVAGLRARAARYDARSQRVVLELTNGTAFAFPIALVKGLESATAAQRATLELSPNGSGVRWLALDADISVPGILAASFGRAIAGTYGKAGGASRSRAKRKAARENGKKGGRPRAAARPSA